MRPIIQREFLSLMRDGRFWIACVLFTALIGVSIVVGLKDQHTKDAVRGHVTNELRKEWDTQSAKDPHSGGHFGTYVVKPGGPVGWFDPGVEPYLGSIAFLEAHVRNEFIHRPAAEMTSARHFGYFSPAFLLQTLAPLLTILFCFSSFAGDRESGVLRQALATGVHPLLLVGGKILGTLAGVAALMAPSLVAAWWLMQGGGGSPDASRLLALTLGYGLYLLAIANLTVWVSSIAPKSQVALAAMITFWIATTFVLPRTISDLAASRSPLPSKAAFAHRVAQETLNGIDGHDPLDSRRAALLESTLKKYKVNRIEDLPVNFDAIALQASEDYTSALYKREFDQAAAQLESQASFVRSTTLFAPYLAIRNWSMSVAGTDFAHHRRYSEAVEGYRQFLIRRLNEDMANNSRTGDYGYFVESEYWEQVPSFEYEEPSLRWSVQSTSGQLGVLALWSLVSAGLCLLSAPRLRP